MIDHTLTSFTTISRQEGSSHDGCSSLYKGNRRVNAVIPKRRLFSFVRGESSHYNKVSTVYELRSKTVPARAGSWTMVHVHRTGTGSGRVSGDAL